jgi:hypothetical protein
MYSDKNIIRKVKTEIDRMTRPFNNKIKKLQIAVRSLRAHVNKLKEDSHPKKESVVCCNCKKTIKEANKLTQSIGDECI